MNGNPASNQLRAGKGKRALLTQAKFTNEITPGPHDVHAYSTSPLCQGIVFNWFPNT